MKTSRTLSLLIRFCLLPASFASANITWNQFDQIGIPATAYDLSVTDNTLNLIYEQNSTLYSITRPRAGGEWTQPATLGPGLLDMPRPGHENDLVFDLYGSLVYREGQRILPVVFGDMGLLGFQPLTVGDGGDNFVVYRDPLGCLNLISTASETPALNSVVPEPATIIMLSMGSLMFLFRRRH